MTYTPAATSERFTLTLAVHFLPSIQPSTHLLPLIQGFRSLGQHEPVPGYRLQLFQGNKEAFPNQVDCRLDIPKTHTHFFYRVFGGQQGQNLTGPENTCKSFVCTLTWELSEENKLKQTEWFVWDKNKRKLRANELHLLWSNTFYMKPTLCPTY